MAVVVFCTTYTLILPAITLDSQTAETEPGIEAEGPAEETLGEVQEADLLLQGQNAEESEIDKDYGELIVEMLCETIKEYAKAPYNAKQIEKKNKELKAKSRKKKNEFDDDDDDLD